MPKEIIVVDSQRLNTLQMCGYKYDQTFNSDLVPIEKQDFFERGDLIHKMLEAYYKMHMYKDRWPADFTKTKILKIVERIGEHHARKLQLPIEEVENVFRTFKDYLDYYWGERFRTLAVERVGSKILYETDDLIILYETKMDWIVEMSNVPVMPVDHKSSYRRGETIAISNQFMGYCWLLGVSNLMVNKVGFQKTLKNEEKFSRPIMSYPPPVIEAWVNNSVYWIMQGLQYKLTKFYPQNFTSCDKYSGCVFRRVCEAPPETRNHTIRQIFEVGAKWDVGRAL
jgi:hypothetical protein